VHCLGSSDTPRITISSHNDHTGTTVWYLGGQLAESGVGRTRAEQISTTRRELAELLPWIDLSVVEFSTLLIERAEAAQTGGKRPDGPGICYRDGAIVAWPTKLALAPLLADQIITMLEHENIVPAVSMPAPAAAYPSPPLYHPPWQQPDRLWL
jgi:hypothetical protein